MCYHAQSLNNANLIKGRGSFCGQDEACGAEIV